MSAAAIGLALALVTPAVHADEVGHGPFAIGFLGFGYTGSFGPAADEVHDVFGVPVNLGTIFPVSTAIDGAVDSIGPDGNFLLNLPGNAALSLSADGQFHCDPSLGCFGGAPIAFNGPVTTITGTAVAGVPAGVTYVVEGTAMNTGGLTFGGTMALNTFEHYNTPPGTDVDVNTSQQWFNTNVGITVPLTVDIHFAEITAAGATTVTAASNGPPLPANFQLNYLGPYGAYLDISTTAAHTGDIEICIGYVDVNGDGVVDGTPASAAALRILHMENGAWVPLPTVVDTANRLICATSTNGLSPFTMASIAGDCDALVRPSVKLKGIGGSAGQLVARGLLPVADGVPVVGSPFTGLRVRVDAGGSPLLDLLTPTGTFDPETQEGWKLDATSSRFAFRSRTTQGVKRARVKPVTGGNYLVLMKAVGLSLPAAPEPITLTIDTDDALEPEGHCGSATTLACRPAGSTGLVCR